MHALHPLYLSLDALAHDMPGDLQGRITEARAALDQPAVEYEGAVAAKVGIARALFDRQGASQTEVRTPTVSRQCWLAPGGVLCLSRRRRATSHSHSPAMPHASTGARRCQNTQQVQATWFPTAAW